MMKRHTRRAGAARRMQGAIAITAALWLMTIIIALGVVDVGHVWWMKRHLQGVADMMALAGAQRLDDTCGGAQTSVAQIALQNGYSGSYAVTCGRFDTALNQLGPVVAPYTGPNAVRVALTSNVKYWFMPMIGSNGTGVSVASTSRVVNIGAFTLGSTLATLNTGNSALLNSVLSTLLGSAVNLNIVSYRALANAQIKLGDLAAQINSNGVNDVVQMLGTSPTLKQVISAINNIVPSTDASKNALNQLTGWANTNSGGLTVPMNGTSGAGLLSIGLDNINAATKVSVNALDAIMVSAMVANAKSGNVAPITAAVALPTGLLNDPANSSVQIKLGQPPVLAIGEAGSLTAVARTQQVQVLLNLQVNVGSGGLLSVPSILKVSLPLYLAVAPATASLAQTQCGAGLSDSSSTIKVQPGIASMCMADNAVNLFNGSSSACGATTTLVNVLNLITVTGAGGSVPLNPGTSQTHTFSGVGNQIAAPNPFVANSNAVGSDLATALSTSGNTLIGNLTSKLTITVLGIPLSLGALGLSAAVQNITDGVVKTIAPALNSVLSQVLNLVGAQVGVATVTDVSLTCGNVQLVK